MKIMKIKSDDPISDLVTTMRPRENVSGIILGTAARGAATQSARLALAQR